MTRARDSGRHANRPDDAHGVTVESTPASSAIGPEAYREPVHELGTFRSTPKSLGVTGVIALVVVGCLLALLIGGLSRQLLGSIALLLMLALIALRVPVGVAMILSGALGIASVSGWNVAINAFETLPFRSVASWPLTVLPMFILMGTLLWRSGATARVYDSARVWINWMPGGLAVTTNFAGAGLAAVSGSTLGITYALGRLSVPEMLRSGYDPRLAVGSVLMAGTGGQLLPPSILMVIYAGVAGTPVGQQLLAGVGPGLLLPLGFGVTIIALASLRPTLAPKEVPEERTFSQKLRLTGATWPVFVLIILVVGGIATGVFTATEAGAYGAAAAVLMAFGFAGLRRGASYIRTSLLETASATAAILLLIIGAGFITRMLSLSGLAVAFSDYMASVELSRIQFLILLMVAYLILGMALDPLTMVILTVPLLVPVLEVMDISLLWFGAFVVLLGELSIVTPPVGMLSFVVHKIVSDPEVSGGIRISLGQVFHSVLWFLPVAVVILLLLILFPGIAVWLPEVSQAR